MSGFYHPTLLKLDAAASEFHEMGMQQARDGAFLLAGRFQQALLAKSPYPRNRRFLHAQWAWALGHIGLLYQLIRWFKANEPDTTLILEATGCANKHFLEALSPHLIITPAIPNTDAALHNAVYFGCPDGVHSLVSFYKMVERECAHINLLVLTPEQERAADALLEQLGVRRPFVALHVRGMAHDAKRNPSEEQVNASIAPYLARGYSVVCTGLDDTPAGAQFPSVRALPDPHLASFLLSASCDQFVGSNSGAWTIAHAFKRAVELLNDHERNAWIYP